MQKTLHAEKTQYLRLQLLGFSLVRGGGAAQLEHAPRNVTRDGQKVTRLNCIKRLLIAEKLSTADLLIRLGFYKLYKKTQRSSPR
jgi:hypothetical protein